MRLDTQRPDRAPNFGFRGLKALPVIVLISTVTKAKPATFTYLQFIQRAEPTGLRTWHQRKKIRAVEFIRDIPKPPATDT